LAFQLQTQIDSTDLAGYLSNSPSLLSQVQGEQVGSYVTDDYVRDLFLATAAIKFIDALPTPAPTPTPSLSGGAAAPNVISSLETIASDCSGVTSVTSGIKCLNDVSSIEKGFETAQIQREACYWSKHVIMPTYSDIQLWAMQRGPYNAASAQALGKIEPSPPPVITSLITVDAKSLGPQAALTGLNSIEPSSVFIDGLDSTQTYNDAEAAMNVDMVVLTTPPGC
jgi:hypothetical protein